MSKTKETLHDQIEAAMRKHTCPTCKGTGRQMLTVHVYGGDVTECDITCVVCKGEGEVTGEVLEALKQEKDMWCRDPEHAEAGAYYVEDTPAMKHHWCCKRCNKIVQIG